MTASQVIVIAIAVFLLMMLAAMVRSRLGVLAALLVTSAVLATASATLGLREWHYLFKPLTMVLALWLVLRRDDLKPTPWLLVAALVASLAGDILLMLPVNLFIPGLAAFLVAHLCYIALFRQQLAWFPNRGALALALGVGAAMLLILWTSLGDPVLKGAVGAYVLVITLMAAQAIGRATVLRDRAAMLVAVGACVFMLSDTLIAVNRFIMPLPLSSLWVLSTYYLAQILIVLHVTRPGTMARS